MSARRAAVILSFAAAMATGCVAEPKASPTNERIVAATFAARESWEPAPPSPSSVPIDETLTPISASSPSKDAKEALDLCGAYQFGLTSVAGMAYLEHVDDARKYARLSPRVPELALDAGAWMIQFRGERADPITRQSWIDATCLVIDGNPHVYATGPMRDLRSGKITSGYYPVDELPGLSLPPLGP
jgi:hypothetical protein